MPNGIQKKRSTATFSLLATLLACMVTKKLSISPGKAMFNWLYSIGAQQPKWFLGSLANRNRFGAWIAFLARGLADPHFLLKFQGTTDAQKEELGRTSEAEFKAGVQLLRRDKSLVMSLVQITGPPVQE